MAECYKTEVAYAGECKVAGVGGTGSSQPTGCECPQAFGQVCGSDGKEYANPCLARCAGAAVANTGPCARAPVLACNCNTGYVPVCSTGNKTFANICMAKCANASVAYDGACPPITIKGVPPCNAPGWQKLAEAGCWHLPSHCAVVLLATREGARSCVAGGG
jgi:coxsackievirus/adenovirus receptor